MKFKFRHTDKIVGLFLLVAIIVLIVSFIIIALSQKIFVKKYEFHTRFKNAVGLSPTTVLKFKGFEIGKLKEFSLNTDNLIDARIVIYEEFRNKIVANSVISKSSNPLTGRSSLEFLQGPDWDDLLTEGEYIPSLSMPKGQKLLEENIIQKEGDVISSVLTNIDNILYNLNQDDNADKGAIFRLLYNLANSSEMLNKDLNRLYDVMGTVNSELQQTTGLLQETLVSTKVLLENYQDPENLLVKMIDPEKKDLITPLSESLIQLNENLSQLDELLKFMNSQTPELSTVIFEGRNSLQTVQKTLEGINNNPLIRKGIPDETKAGDSNSKLRPKDF
jgi:phospholipid/cholesterol/gamma-HCH transport system substrate-binding protein